jgi:uncharacterized delta-60 repeat protein
VVHLSSNGKPDPTFNNGGGKAVLDFAGQGDRAHAVAVGADGKIVVAGEAQAGGLSDFALARLNADGTLDTSFAGTGKTTLSLGANDAALGVALQADGKIVVAGQAGINGGDVGIARYENDHVDFSPVASLAGEASGSALIGLLRTGGVRGTVSVTVTPTGGTATPGADYVAAPIVVTFNEGETSKVVSLPLINDALVEGNETVELTLTDPTGGVTVGTADKAVVTILDNSGPVAEPAADVSAVVAVIRGKARLRPSGRYRQRVTLLNTGTNALHGPLVLVLDKLTKSVKLFKPDGVTQAKAPKGSQYRLVIPDVNKVFKPGDSMTVFLQFTNPLGRKIKYTPRVLAGNGLL